MCYRYAQRWRPFATTFAFIYQYVSLPLCRQCKRARAMGGDTRLQWISSGVNLKIITEASNMKTKKF